MIQLNKPGILWITRTALLITLLVVVQIVTAPLSNPLITGSAVNLILVVAVMTCGIMSGLSVAVVSPVMAKFLGIGPLWSLIPFIIAGNMTLVLLWHLLGNRAWLKAPIQYIIAVICAAVAKFLVLYLGIVRLAVPVLLKLPDPQATVISGMFSVPQLITALIGGAIAAVLLPVLKKALRLEGA